MFEDQDGRTAAGLRCYVYAVARALGVEPEASWSEVAQRAVAYIALSERAHEYPDRDVMLLWDEEQGWSLALEPEREEKAVQLTHVGGAEIVPAPTCVAREVRAALRRHHTYSAGLQRHPRRQQADVEDNIIAYARSGQATGRL